MKRLLFYFHLLLTTNSLGQLTFSDPYLSSSTEGFQQANNSNGNILTLTSKKGFFWALPNLTSISDTVFATLLCVSSGSSINVGKGSFVENGFPGSYSKNSVILPVVGGNFEGLNADSISFYYPFKPAQAARTVQSITGASPVLEIRTTLVFKKEASTFQFDVYKGNTNTTPSQTITGSASDTVSFEILNCGSASFCIQNSAQFQESPGVCEPGEITTCSTPTCTNVPYQTDCSTASNFIIDNGYCLTQCPSTSIQTPISPNLSICESCLPSCKECSEITSKCISCLADHFLYQNECLSECPVGFMADLGSGECREESVLEKVDLFVLVVLIGVGALMISISTILFIFFKVKAPKDRNKVKVIKGSNEKSEKNDKNEKNGKVTPRKRPQQQIFVEVLTTTEDLLTSPTMKDIDEV